MADTDWITPDLINLMIREAEEHKSRRGFLSQLKRGNRYYSASEEWWVPLDGKEDEDIAGDEPYTRENIIYDTVNEGSSILL